MPLGEKNKTQLTVAKDEQILPKLIYKIKSSQQKISEDFILLLEFEDMVLKSTHDRMMRKIRIFLVLLHVKI